MNIHIRGIKVVKQVEFRCPSMPYC